MKKLICDGLPLLQTFRPLSTFYYRHTTEKRSEEITSRKQSEKEGSVGVRAPNAACPKCSMPQMQHAPFRHVRVAYPRIISAPVSARIKYTNSSGNNQTMSRGEKEVSGGVAGVPAAADIHRECTPSCVRGRALPRAPLPTKAGASGRHNPAGRHHSHRRGDRPVAPTHLRQCLLLSFANESRRSRFTGNISFVTAYLSNTTESGSSRAGVFPEMRLCLRAPLRSYSPGGWLHRRTTVVLPAHRQPD